jgi:serine protease Do
MRYAPWRSWRRWAATAVAVLQLLSPPGYACPPHAALPEVIACILPSVVTVEATRIVSAAPSGGAPAHTSHQVGAGFIIDPDGTIVTNLHVIQGTQEVLVTLYDGTELAAVPGPHNTNADLVLLAVRAPNRLPAVRFGDSDRLRVGDTVIAVGNPYGLSNTVSTGIVSALNRNIAESDYDDYIQTDAAINHGNSGGPLFNLQGEVIGINSMIFAPAGSGGSIGLGFAMPSNDLRFVVGQLRRFGYPRRGFLGAVFQDVPQKIVKGLGAGAGRVVVTEVAPDTPASRAGLLVGDIVERFAGVAVPDARALARAIAEAPIGHLEGLMVSRPSGLRRLPVMVAEAAHNGAPVMSAAAPATVATTEGLGMTLAPLSAAVRRVHATAPGQGGMLVTGVTEHRPAAEAGLQAGDIIVMAERHSVDDQARLMKVLRNARLSGSSFASLLVLSRGRFHWVALSLQAKP